MIRSYVGLGVLGVRIAITALLSCVWCVREGRVLLIEIPSARIAR